MHINRRTLIRGAASLPLVAILTRCGGSSAQLITIAEQEIADAQNIEAAVNAALAASGAKLTTEEQTIETAANTVLAQADKALSGLTVGALVSPTTVSAILADLSVALTDAGTIVPGNPYVAAAALVLAALQAAWGAANMGATMSSDDLAVSRVYLSSLPRYKRPS